MTLVEVCRPRQNAKDTTLPRWRGRYQCP